MSKEAVHEKLRWPGLLNVFGKHQRAERATLHALGFSNLLLVTHQAMVLFKCLHVGIKLGTGKPQTVALSSVGAQGAKTYSAIKVLKCGALPVGVVLGVIWALEFQKVYWFQMLDAMVLFRPRHHLNQTKTITYALSAHRCSF